MLSYWCVALFSGKVVNSLFMEQKQVKGSVSNMREEVNVLDGAAKKALDVRAVNSCVVHVRADNSIINSSA